MDEGAFYESIQKHIDHIDPEQKVSEQVLERRLAICKQCSELINGMCRICGCYVELRAVMKIRECPHVYPKWEKETQ